MKRTMLIMTMLLIIVFSITTQAQALPQTNQYHYATSEALHMQLCIEEYTSEGVTENVLLNLYGAYLADEEFKVPLSAYPIFLKDAFITLAKDLNFTRISTGEYPIRLIDDDGVEIIHLSLQSYVTLAQNFIVADLETYTAAVLNLSLSEPMPPVNIGFGNLLGVEIILKNK